MNNAANVALVHSHRSKYAYLCIKRLEKDSKDNTSRSNNDQNLSEK